MRLQYRWGFSWPNSRALLVRRHLDRPTEPLTFDSHREGFSVVVQVDPEVKAFDGKPDWLVATSENRCAVYAVTHLEVHADTERELEWPEADSSRARILEIGRELFPLAAEAANEFLRTTRWRTRQHSLLNSLSEDDCKTVHFYADGKRLPFGEMRAFLELATEATFESALSETISETIQQDLRDRREPRVAETLLADARQYLAEKDYRAAAVMAGIALEISMAGLLRRLLGNKDITTRSQVNKFLDEMSNRLLCTVVLGLCGVGDTAFREKCRQAFHLRNRAAHGKRFEVDRQQVIDAIDAADQMIGLWSLPQAF